MSRRLCHSTTRMQVWQLHLGVKQCLFPTAQELFQPEKEVASCILLSSPSYGSRLERKRLKVWLVSTVKTSVVSATGFPFKSRRINLIVWELPLTFTRTRSVSRSPSPGLSVSSYEHRKCKGRNLKRDSLLQPGIGGDRNPVELSGQPCCAGARHVGALDNRQAPVDRDALGEGAGGKKYPSNGQG